MKTKEIFRIYKFDEDVEREALEVCVNDFLKSGWAIKHQSIGYSNGFATVLITFVNIS